LLDGGEMLLLDEPRRVVPEYQRLLYATSEAAARLRPRIKAEGARRDPGASERQTVLPAVPLPDAALPVAAFDPDLRSTSTVEFPARGARIHAPRITTAAGEVVNVLVRGDRYTYGYEVEFLQPARRACFGMMIKSTSGLELGGDTFAEASGGDAEIPAGARVSVRFGFDCQLFAGMYFVNAGLMGEVDGTYTYLHRIVDAVAFRVAPDASGKRSGYVDFDVQGAVAPMMERGSGPG